MSLIFSVEETNRLREKLGLKLIPIDARTNGIPNRKSADDSKDISISLQETNKLRLKLGLKLIPDNDLYNNEEINYINLKKQRDDQLKVNSIRTNLKKIKKDLRKQKRIEKGGILDRISKSENVESDAHLSLDDWLSNVGEKINRNFKVKKLSFKKKNKDKPSVETKDVELEGKSDIEDADRNIKISHDKANFNDMMAKDNEVVLTLKDTNVLDEDSDNEILENKQLKYQESIKKSMNEKLGRGKLVSQADIQNDKPFISDVKDVDTFTLNDKTDVSNKRKIEFLDMDLESSDEDDGLNFDESKLHNKKISKFIKRDVSKFKKSKKSSTKVEKRTFTTELIDKELKPVLLESFDDEGDDDVFQLDQMLKVTRQSNLNKNKPIVVAKLETKPIVESHVVKEKTEILDEDLDFLNNIKIEPDEDKKFKEKSNIVKTDEISEKNIEATQSDKSNKNMTRYKAILESHDDLRQFSGISDMLSILKTGKDKDQQSKPKTNEVKITYTDDDGNVLNTKEAFKYLSHKFHGSKKK